MVGIVSADKAEAVLKLIKAQRYKAWTIGEVVTGKGEARVVQTFRKIYENWRCF